MTRRFLAILVLFPILSAQQCVESLPQSTGTPPTQDPPPQVTLQTNRGNIVIELYPVQAQAATLFKQYVEEGYYDNTVFYLVNAGQSIAGGKYKTSLASKIARPTVVATNNLTNLRGRVSLLTPQDATEAIPAFAINLADSTEAVDADTTIIGRVVSGLSVADAISNVQTITRTAADETSLSNLPKTPISVNNPTLSITDYTNPAGDPQEDANGIPPKNTTTDPSENQAPVADAKASTYVGVGVIANLNGTSSYDANGDTLTYQWTQTAGPTVTINDATQAHATYTVPTPDEDQQSIGFQLTVQDPSGAQSQTTVTQSILLNPSVRLTTTLGDMVFSMLTDTEWGGAPVTVLNFLQYVEDGFYNGTIFHRVMPGFIVQGGGFLPGLTKQSGTRDAIVNEYDLVRSNTRGTVAMAKVGDDPDSATSQFFINLVDNSANLDSQNGGFTVFANVDDAGMSVADNMAAQPTSTQSDSSGNSFDDVPVTNVVVQKAVVEP